MSYESFKTRMRVTGVTPRDSSITATKQAQSQYILHSPDCKNVEINLDNTTSLPCIVSDKETYKVRRFLFLPNNKIYLGDYITVDGLNYLVTEHTLDDIYPQVIASHCNFDFPIRTIETKVRDGSYSDGRPKWKIETTTITKPSAITSKIYSSSDNYAISSPNGITTAILPYSSTREDLPMLNDKIFIEESQYTVRDIKYENVFPIDGLKRGYVEIHLEKEAKS